MSRAQAQAKARVLTEALPYIRRWSGKRVVVKAGGETVDKPGMLDSLARDVALMRAVGLHPIVVNTQERDIYQSSFGGGFNQYGGGVGGSTMAAGAVNFRFRCGQ